MTAPAPAPTPEALAALGPPPRLSVIVAVRDQLEMNRLFLESLRASTEGTHELIVVDNGSTDGSRELFEAAGARVIANGGNYSYPRCQNQGAALARGEWLAFLNNDLLLPRGWDSQLLEAMAEHGLDVASPCGLESAEDPAVTRRLHRRWNRIKYAVLAILGTRRAALRLMPRLMYGNLDRFAAARRARLRHRVKEGFVGCCVVQSRRALELLGPWDERVQAGDFDLYLRSKQRSLERGDIRPCHVALDVYVHHYVRLTLRGSRAPFLDADRLVSLDDKWGRETAARLLAMRAPD